MTPQPTAGLPPDALYRQAEGRLAAGDAAGAGVLLDRVLEAAPRHAAALFLRGRLHLMAGRPAQASAVLAAGRDADPSSAPMAFLHGLALHLDGRQAEAAEAFGAALRIDPGHGDAALFLTRSLHASGDHAGCRAARERLVGRFGDDPRLLNEVASDLIEEGEEPEAASLLERVLALAPGMAAALHNLGAACARLGMVERAEGLLREALGSGTAPPATRATLAEILRLRGKRQEAGLLARTLLAAPAAEAARAEAVLGALAMEAGDPEEGLARLRKAAAADPGSATALWNLACAFEDLRRIADAASCWQAIQDTTPDAGPDAADPRAARICQESASRLRLARGMPGPGEALMPLARLSRMPASAPDPFGAGTVELEDVRLFADHWHLMRCDGTLALDLVFHLPVTDDMVAVHYGWEGRALVRSDLREERIGEPALFLGGAHNYYHWLADFLPRLAVLDGDGGPGWRDRRLVVNSRLAPYQKRALELLGIEEGRLLHAPAGRLLAFERLAVPRLPERRLREDGVPEWMAPALTVEVAAWLRGRFAPWMRPEPGAARRLMILRGNTLIRRCVNEDQLLEVAKQHGFAPVHPEELPLERQIALFAGAEAVLAVHGAGCANMLFAPSGSHLLEMHPAGHLPDFYPHLCGLLGQGHTAIGGPPVQSVGALTPAHWHFRVDPSELDEALSSLGRG
jgi:capsular polysaccharide biosynthesis protein/thioredoxin-like negative regulator of GroEL